MKISSRHAVFFSPIFYITDFYNFVAFPELINHHNLLKT